MALRYLSALLAQQIDVELMSTEGGFAVEQLMELAGLGCAEAIVRHFGQQPGKRALICCGPGNNGGDGLVAARHLVHFGWRPTIYYPKASSKPLFQGLVRQNRVLGVPFLLELSQAALGEHDVVVDAIFGFSFKSGEIRAPFDTALQLLQTISTPIASVDIPSGWDVDQGPPPGPHITPDVLISLTAPKACARFFRGAHYLAGRFVPPSMAARLELNLPAYSGTAQCLLLPAYEPGRL